MKEIIPVTPRLDMELRNRFLTLYPDAVYLILTHPGLQQVVSDEIRKRQVQNGNQDVGLRFRLQSRCPDMVELWVDREYRRYQAMGLLSLIQ